MNLFNEEELEQDLSLLEMEQEEAVTEATTGTRKKWTTDKVWCYYQMYTIWWRTNGRITYRKLVYFRELDAGKWLEGNTICNRWRNWLE